MVVAAFLFIRRMSAVANITAVTSEEHVHADLDDALDHGRALVAGDGLRAATTAG
jgi:hypothetical protein